MFPYGVPSSGQLDMCDRLGGERVLVKLNELRSARDVSSWNTVQLLATRARVIMSHVALLKCRRDVDVSPRPGGPGVADHR